MDVINAMQSFVIAALIGLVVGIERERSQGPRLTTLGVRTFTLLAILGALTGWINTPWLSTTLAVFALGGVLLAYWRSTQLSTSDQHVGITTEFSAGIVFALGYLTQRAPLLAMILAVLLLLILIARQTLHRFSRSTLQPQEIRAAITLMIMLFGILPFLPDQSFDPWQLLNLQRIGLLIALISTLQFSGYIAVRMFGQHLGLSLNSFFGGLVSSTLVLMHLCRLHQANPILLRPAVASALLACSASLLQVILILYIVSPILAAHMLFPLFNAALTGFVIAVYLLRQEHENIMLPMENNPLDLRTVVQFTLIVLGMSLLVAIIRSLAGDQAVIITAFFGGLLQLQSTTFATANLFLAQKVQINIALAGICFATVASIVSKWIILFTLNRSTFASFASGGLLGMLCIGTMTFFVQQGMIF